MLSTRIECISTMEIFFQNDFRSFTENSLILWVVCDFVYIIFLTVDIKGGLKIVEMLYRDLYMSRYRSGCDDKKPISVVLFRYNSISRVKSTFILLYDHCVFLKILSFYVCVTYCTVIRSISFLSNLKNTIFY